MNKTLINDLGDCFSKFRRLHWNHKKTGHLCPSEFQTLRSIIILHKEGLEKVKVSDISNLLEISRPSVTQNLNTLEKKDLINRDIDPLDRRAIIVTLSPKGLALEQKMHQHREEIFSDLIDHLGEAESRHLITLLSKTYDYFEKYNTKGEKLDG